MFPQSKASAANRNWKVPTRGTDEAVLVETHQRLLAETDGRWRTEATSWSLCLRWVCPTAGSSTLEMFLTVSLPGRLSEVCVLEMHSREEGQKEKERGIHIIIMTACNSILLHTEYSPRGLFSIIPERGSRLADPAQLCLSLFLLFFHSLPLLCCFFSSTDTLCKCNLLQGPTPYPTAPHPQEVGSPLCCQEIWKTGRLPVSSANTRRKKKERVDGSSRRRRGGREWRWHRGEGNAAAAVLATKKKKSL